MFGASNFFRCSRWRFHRRLRSLRVLVSGAASAVHWISHSVARQTGVGHQHRMLQSVSFTDSVTRHTTPAAGGFLASKSCGMFTAVHHGLVVLPARRSARGLAPTARPQSSPRTRCKPIQNDCRTPDHHLFPRGAGTLRIMGSIYGSIGIAPATVAGWGAMDLSLRPGEE